MKNIKDTINIRDLYPHYSPEELAEAEYNFRRYVAALTRIYERLREKGISLDDLNKEDSSEQEGELLTPLEGGSTIPEERSTH